MPNREVLDTDGSAMPAQDGGTLVEECKACGSSQLVPHMAVAGQMGDQGLIPTTKEFGTALGDIVRCTQCTHMQLDRFPSEAELDAAYEVAASDDYVDEEAGQLESARRVLERIERHTAKGPILDLGCWVGFLLAAARDRGWEPTGVEPSTFASAYARDRLGLDVRTEELFTADLPKHHYNAVILGDVLEHLTRAGDALERVSELLAPDGVLVLLLPDAGSAVARRMGKRWWSVIPTHVHYFTRRSAATMLARHGFQVREIATDPKAFTIRYYLNKGGGYLPWLSRTLIKGAARIGVADNMWAPDFRDRMVVIAAPAGASDRAAG